MTTRNDIERVLWKHVFSVFFVQSVCTASSVTVTNTCFEKKEAFV